MTNFPPPSEDKRGRRMVSIPLPREVGGRRIIPIFLHPKNNGGGPHFGRGGEDGMKGEYCFQFLLNNVAGF